MSAWKKLSAAPAASTGGPDIDEVFSTYLYTGTNTTNTITNGIDLAGEGGLVWTKGRSAARANNLWDTERGAYNVLWSDQTLIANESSLSAGLSAFNSNGFTLTGNYYSEANIANTDYVSWTFRKATNFFDIVTYTGNGTSGRTVPHNLGSVPGMIIVKNISNGLSNSLNSYVYHAYADPTAPQNYYMQTQSTSAALASSGAWNNTAPTATEFTVGNVANVNSSGQSYVAYLFANHNGDGGFGPNSDQDVIKMGVYNGNGSAAGQEIDVGFEPQYILIKNEASSNRWMQYDVSRGATSANGLYLNWQAADAEVNSTVLKVGPTATGFRIYTSNSNLNSSGGKYTYMVIRRGSLYPPESSSEVFAIDTRGGTSPTPPGYTADFLVDMGIERDNVTATDDIHLSTQLTQLRYVETNKTSAEAPSTNYAFDYQDGWTAFSTARSNAYSWMWKRAPKYFDVSLYKGNGASSRDIPHNLEAVPEMIWVKARTLTTAFTVYHKGAGNQYRGEISTSDAFAASTATWNDTTPTDSVFTVGFAGAVNSSGREYMALSFATIDGISKVGSYSGSNSDLNIDCGFSNGAKFILIKRTDAVGNWAIWDTSRGITAGGNDPFLALNLTNAQFTTLNVIEPYSSGFTVKGNINYYNQAGGSFIFYAVAAP